MERDKMGKELYDLSVEKGSKMKANCNFLSRKCFSWNYLVV